MAAFAVARWIPDFRFATISTRFSYEAAGAWLAGIPRQPPLARPALAPAAAGRQPIGLSFELIRALAPSAFAIAMLGAIESLLSAVVADGMTGHKHDPDVELIAQGVGQPRGAVLRRHRRHGGAGPHGGQRALGGALARWRRCAIPSSSCSPSCCSRPSWATCPWPPWPRCSSSWPGTWASGGTSRTSCGRAPRSDILVLLVCFALTIVFDMVVSVTVGIVLAALLFMRRMAEVSGVTLVGRGASAASRSSLPRGVLLYEIAGPLFFGAAQRAIGVISRVDRRGVKVVVLDVTAVPAVDATGLVNLQSLVARLNTDGDQGHPGRRAGPAHARLREGALADAQGPAAHLPVVRSRDRSGEGDGGRRRAALARAAGEPA